MLGKFDSWSLNIPVTLPPYPHGARNTDNTTVIEESFSLSTPSTVTAWGNQDLFALSVSSGDIAGAHGVAVGCKDGSLFILRSASNSASLQPNIAVSIPPTPSPPEPTSPPTSPRRYRGLGHPSSRSASPSSLKSALSPFQLSRSRVVSAVSTESAEAPKNYVDFDEERERMRGMLKGRKSRERHSSTSRTRQEKDLSASSQSTSAQISSLRKEDTRNYLSAALSPSSSTLSLSNPPSPTFPPAASPEPNGALALNLRCHVYPPYARPGSSVSTLKVHEAGRYISCLHESGGLSVHASIDGSCIASTLVEAKSKPASAGKAQATPSVLWVWRNLLVAASEESILLFACASPDELYPNNQFLDASSGDSENQTLVVAYELCLGADAVAGEAKLEQLGQWTVSGPLNSIGLRAEHDHSLTFFHTGPGGHLVSRSLTVHDPPPEPADLPGSHSSNHLPLPNPFKALKALSTENIPDTETSTGYERIELGDPIDHGDLGLTEPLLGLRAHDNGTDVRLCAWTARELSICKWTQSMMEKLPVVPVSGVRDVRWIDHDSISLLSEDGLAVYAVLLSAGEKPEEARPKLTQTIPLSPYDVATLVPGGHAVSTRVKNGRHRIHHTCLALPDSAIAQAKTRALWKARADAFATQSAPRISSALPLELDLIILGYTDGRIRRTSLLEGAQNSDASAQWSDFALPGAVLALDVVQNHRTGERVLVGGADDGTIAVWALNTLKLCARWTVFTTPLARVISLEDEGVGRLHGCVLCISQDGTIAVIAVDGYQFVYLVPASAAPLRRVCLGENNLLLVYTDGRARLWDTGTREFWRSMSVEKAEELLLQGGWHEWYMDRASDKKQALASPGYTSPDAASTVSLDIPALLKQLSPSAALSSTSFSSKKKLEHARALLSILLTFGISEGIDTICNEGLAIKPASATLGISSPETLVIVPQHSSSSIWTVSPEASADRALAILTLLQFLAQFEDLAQDASTVTTFYAASIGQLVPDHQHPSLPRLAHHMLHIQSAEVRQAVRLLLDAGVARLADSETTELVEVWQQYLMRTDKEKDLPQSAKALCICGFIAVDKYTLLPTSTLTDIAKSIALYLHDETSPHRSLAIDLCSRGFQVWQQYVDAVEMLRALFTLATTTKKEAIAVPNIGVQARSAVLQIAAGNTPLFMTTLAIDILQPRSVQHRKSVMQLVIFLIRKKPLVLYSNLPRLVEAIVKSLDPNSSASRDAVLDSATEILSHIVQTFPTVDFHMATQRLAVGTSEGAVVMYDLKTATRLYVLEGHKKRTTACSFSPDGRRLVTMSLEEQDVLVWKVGSSFTSLFMPGAPPRQGHGGSEPFKRLEFHIGEAAHMGIETTLTNVQFEWTAERSVRLKIRDSILTFST
ncbi:WD40 repeat-like protein [Trametes versicolor FP-101664 SS1]|uniref:WD40 repeat-like protein n=1 Tax=Trametes versicolor (strain FP-101664) TaxID=717944 RepID=UPI0004621D13|nr:WD40 repeat-like protein [Trametes versicolor FP-101664 SS1]EIW52425.1 WD40 repeat-like protein [Trametes versicolor FP-101664 SS1]